MLNLLNQETFVLQGIPDLAHEQKQSSAKKSIVLTMWKYLVA
jgi:hypothetical protein